VVNNTRLSRFTP